MHDSRKPHRPAQAEESLEDRERRLAGQRVGPEDEVRKVPEPPPPPPPGPPPEPSRGPPRDPRAKA